MSEPRPRTAAPPRDPGGPFFWLAVAVGIGMVGFGAAGLLRDLPDPALRSWATWFLGALAAHDALFAPAVALVALAVARLAPRWLRAPLQAALAVSVAVALIALPLVGGWGRRADDPSHLPLPYGRNLLIVLGIVWAVAAAWAALRRRRQTDGRVPPA